jgi:hypothetical protein
MDTYLETIQLSERHFGRLEKGSTTLDCEMVVKTIFWIFEELLEVARVTAYAGSGRQAKFWLHAIVSLQLPPAFLLLL